MATGTEFVPTSICTSMTAMLRDIHQRRSIGIFSGPPGIGKTTAIDAFAAEHAGNVVVVKLNRTGKQGIGARMVMQETVDAARVIFGNSDNYVYLDTYAVKSQLARVVAIWASRQMDAPRLTFVFDEAQCLSRDAIETLRYWNDRDRCFADFPIGLAFVGNQEFALSPAKGKPSVISAAVADRARYTESFDYESVENDDFKMILAAHGITDELVVASVVKRYDGGRRPRSIRRLVETDIPDMKLLAGDRPVTLDIARQALAA